MYLTYVCIVCVMYVYTFPNLAIDFQPLLLIRYSTFLANMCISDYNAIFHYHPIFHPHNLTHTTTNLDIITNT